MQSSFLILTSAVDAVATSTECSDVVALLNDNECCEDNCEAETKELVETTSSSGDNQQIIIVATVGSICMACIVGLLASAFMVDLAPESCIDYDVTVASETTQTLVAFVMGWAMCYMAKCRHDLPGQVRKMSCSAGLLSAFVCSSTASAASAATGRYQSVREWFSSQGPKIGEILCVALVGIMCTGCIFTLFISAFTAVPDEDPTDDGFASESSQTMKAFTVGWMFLLAYKLRRELVEVGGSLMEPF